MNSRFFRPRLYACTSNRDKLAEFIAAGKDAGISLDIEPLPNLASIAPPVEDGVTYEENAAIKALYYSGFTGEPVFSDDSGLEVDALGNAPGIHSARYAGPNASYAENNARLLSELSGQHNRSARFVCAIALARCGTVQKIVRGVVAGQILIAPAGNRGFGYDPLFFYPPLGCSFGELAGPEKLAVSARGRAFRSLLANLEAQ